MPPKKAQAQSAKGKANNAPATKKGKKKDDSDDDFALLEEASKKADATRAAKEKADTEKKAQLQKKKDEQNAAVMAALGPVYVDEVAQYIYDSNTKAGHSVGGYRGRSYYQTEDTGMDTFDNKSWLSYPLHNFLNRVVEDKRKLLMRTKAAPDGEEVTSFECRDLSAEKKEEGGFTHSWNVIKTASGTYAIDLSVEQFDPDGFMGFFRDEDDAPGAVAVHGASRMRKGEKGKAPHGGVVATDAGIFPKTGGGKTVIAKGIVAGTEEAYVAYLKKLSRRKGKPTEKQAEDDDLSVAEEASAQYLTHRVLTRHMMGLHEGLVTLHYTKPLSNLKSSRDKEDQDKLKSK